MGRLVSFGSTDNGDGRHLCRRELPSMAAIFDSRRKRRWWQPRSSIPPIVEGAIFECSCGVTWDYTVGGCWNTNGDPKEELVADIGIYRNSSHARYYVAADACHGRLLEATGLN